MDSDELITQFRLLRNDPARYLELCNRLLDEDAGNTSGILFSRHQAWRELGRPDLALTDLDRANALRPHAIGHMARGQLLMGMGRYPEALTEYNTAQAMASKEWADYYGPYFRADCHARLGNLAAALADCADLADDHWTPGIHGAPPGNKEQVTEQIRGRARDAARQG